MRRSVSLLLPLAASLVAVVIAAASFAQPAAPARIDIPAQQWVALDMPLERHGITGGVKHVTGTLNPDNGRLYFTGGDYRGAQFGNSYRQETWSFSIAERWASRGDRNAGWKLEYPYCGPAGQVQPKHPDFHGWAWDAKRKLFWMVPGTLEISSDNCPGETAGRVSDPGFLLNRIMQFDPATRQWKDVSGNVGAFVETWMSVLDPKTDTLIRFGYSGGSGSMVSVYRIADNKWVNKTLPPNDAKRDIRINKEYLAADLVDRVIYSIDGTAGRLHRYQMDSQKMEDLGPVPGGARGSENFMYVVWDSVNRVLIWFRDTPAAAHAYHPEAKRWEALPMTADKPGARVYGRVLVYDELQNVTMLFGGVEPENPHMFLFRYGEGR
ncbi:MAG TPA: hypothetical protein VML54_02680 [Candidatus Limnocylindrales bacterium]|nr:hypothetical protein [Candidatus Limnocylindrales bacterium]